MTRHVGALTRSSTSEELAGVLRDEILRGDLHPDEPMRETALAERYDVSRRTVREALSMLGHAGLVRHHRHKGSRVASLDAEDIRDLYQVRRTLELSAAQASPHARPERLAALDAAFDELAEATRVGHAEDIVARDLGFHRAVVGLLDSTRMDTFFEAISLEMRYALSILEASTQESQRRPAAALREHRAIRDALVAGDVATATHLIGEHADVNETLLTSAVDGAGATVAAAL